MSSLPTDDLKTYYDNVLTQQEQDKRSFSIQQKHLIKQLVDVNENIKTKQILIDRMRPQDEEYNNNNNESNNNNTNNTESDKRPSDNYERPFNSVHHKTLPQQTKSKSGRIVGDPKK